MLIVSILILCFTGMGDRDGASAFILLRSKARGIGLIAAGQIFLDYAWLEIVIQGLLDHLSNIRFGSIGDIRWIFDKLKIGNLSGR
jgi:hypothetical protein